MDLVDRVDGEANVKISTGFELHLRTREVKERVRDEVQKALTDAVEQTMVVDARARAPVAGEHRSRYKWGMRPRRLREDIYWNPFKKIIGGILRAKFPGLWLEWGTVKMPARPFMRQAFAANKEAVMRRLRGIIR